ncbi:MAG: DUF1731 domain-containing protein [Rubripirellula sp.]|nr:DUF1731 domain-containing protein [Rubripirellula sp.]
MSVTLKDRRIVIAGGSGFLGISLAEHLTDRGASVVILSRSAPKISGQWKHALWDGRTLGEWRHELDGADGLVNLAGRTVNCIKTPDHCDEILRSRVEATQILGKAMRTNGSPPPVWVQMSTAHIYGDPPTLLCSEESSTGYGLAPFVGKAWEQAFAESVLPDQRQVVLRTSFVVGRDLGAGAGALDTLRPLARVGFGGRVGSGTQGMSWIHEQDMNRIFERALTNTEMRGIYIATAPNPVSQAEFMRELRRAVGMPIGLPAFSWMVRVGARYILRTDPELALYGRYVRSTRLAEEEFEFHIPTIRDAMTDLFRKQNGR